MNNLQLSGLCRLDTDKQNTSMVKHMYYLDAKISNHNWIDET